MNNEPVKRILITGGAGFIGSNLAELFLQMTLHCWDNLRIVDDYSSGKKENIEGVIKWNGPGMGIEIIEGDLLDEKCRTEALKDVDVVVHLAALPSVQKSIEDPIESNLRCGDLTLRMLNSARLAGVRRFIYAASSAAYGDSPTLPKHENMVPKPISPYGASKLAGEGYVSAFAASYGMETVSLRYFNVYGPRQDPGSPYSGVISKFCKSILKKEPVTIFGDGTQTRDFTYVRDVCEANVRAVLTTTPLKGQVINIGSGKRTSVNELLAGIYSASGLVPQPAIYEPARPGDIQDSEAAIWVARTVLGYKPESDIEHGLRYTMHWFKSKESLA